MNAETIAELVARARAAGIEELAWSDGEERIRLRLSATHCGTARPAVATAVPAVSAPEACIRSPGVGILRHRHPVTGRSPAAGGAGVEAGQIVAYLEAREVLKGVAAPQAGVLGAPIAADGAVVGFGDALFAFDKR